MTTASKPWDLSATAASSRVASGRRGHGSDRDWPTSKNSATIFPRAGSISVRARLSCQPRLAAGSCWSSVPTLP